MPLDDERLTDSPMPMPPRLVVKNASNTAMSGGTPASSARNCTPSNRKIAAFSTKMTRSHTERFWSLESGASVASENLSGKTGQATLGGAPAGDNRAMGLS